MIENIRLAERSDGGPLRFSKRASICVTQHLLHAYTPAPGVVQCIKLCPTCKSWGSFVSPNGRMDVPFDSGSARLYASHNTCCLHTHRRLVWFRASNHAQHARSWKIFASPNGRMGLRASNHAQHSYIDMGHTGSYIGHIGDPIWVI